MRARAVDNRCQPPLRCRQRREGESPDAIRSRGDREAGRCGTWLAAAAPRSGGWGRTTALGTALNSPCLTGIFSGAMLPRAFWAAVRHQVIWMQFDARSVEPSLSLHRLFDSDLAPLFWVP